MDGMMEFRAGDAELLNSLTQLYGDIAGAGLYESGSPQINQIETLFQNNRWYMISNFRQLLSQLFVEHGIIQTLVEQPVNDAFRAGYELKTSQLSADDIEQIKVFDERNGTTRSLMTACNWARLYGGGAVLIITDQDPLTPLDLKLINPKSRLEFRAVDMWELYFDNQNVRATLNVGGDLGANRGEFYNYYGMYIHKSRVYRTLGKEAPSFIRPRLRGWAMSELERIVRPLNQFMKNANMIFELMDEAKVDVYKIKGYNAALATPTGTNNVQKRIQLANRIKSFNSGITMDADDDYIQKQITFTGLADVLLQIRQDLAADLKMPMTKLFGISAAGFNSGEDDIENYNSMIEGEIRNKVKFMHVDLLQIVCCKLFGTTVDDLMLEYPSLRILNAKEEEEVKDSQFNRVVSAYSAGLMEDIEAKEALNKDSLLPIELDANVPAKMPIEGDFTTKGGATGKAGKKTPEQE